MKFSATSQFANLGGDLYLPEGIIEVQINAVSINSAGLLSLTFPASCNKISTLSSVSNILNGIGIRTLKLTGNYIYFNSQYTFHNAGNLTSVIFPKAIEIQLNAAQSAFGRCGALNYIRLPMPTGYFASGGTMLYTSYTGNLFIDIDQGWKYTFKIVDSTSATYSQSLSYACMIDIISKLVDYRADGATTPTITANGTSAIVGTNTQFLKVHYVGETIYINGVAKIIQAITDDTHMTMTTTVTAGTNVSYGSNKVLSIYTYNIAVLTAAEIAVATNKGWTIN
jgi:hypothetical protein